MDTVELYTFEDADGCESTFTTFKAQEAEEYGRKYGLKVIAQQFEYTDSEVVWDFRPDAPVQRRLVREVQQIGDVETRECSRCGVGDIECTFRVSPYDYEINGVAKDDVSQASWMCEDCVDDSAIVMRFRKGGEG